VANETWDLGDIRLEKAGTLRIQARGADGSKIAKATATAARSGGSLLHYSQFEDGTGTFNGLQPGNYVLNVDADDCTSVCTRCEVTSERETSLEVTFGPGVAHAVRFQFPSGQVSRTLHADLHDAAGRLVADQWLWGIRDGWREWKLGLAPGTYRLEATTPNGWRGSGVLEVTGTPASTPTRIELR
jgi:hypothetical protein